MECTLVNNHFHLTIMASADSIPSKSHNTLVDDLEGRALQRLAIDARMHRVLSALLQCE